MKIQIRKGVFETNSSSTHAIVVDNEYNKIPSEVFFRFGEFGWEHEIYDDVISRCSYLFTLMAELLEKDIQPQLDKIREWFEESCIYFEYEPFLINEDGWVEPEGKQFYYVDHSENARDFMEYCLDSKENLFNFLFGENSKILTGNDNDNDERVSWYDVQSEYPNCRTFSKGN